MEFRRSPRLRPLRRSSGQDVPIIVCTSVHEGLYCLVDGLHRLAAAKKLGWSKIRAEILSGSLPIAGLIAHEITTNLIRGELSAAERAIQSAKLQEVSADKKAFVTTIAKSTGRDVSTVRRDVQRGKWPWLDKLVGTRLDRDTEIDALNRLEANQRDTLIERARTGENVSARAEIKHAPETRETIVRRGKSAIKAWKKEFAGYPEFAEIIAMINAWEYGRGGFLEIG